MHLLEHNAERFAELRLRQSKHQPAHPYPASLHVVVYGDDVIAEPMLVPSTLNCTFATATLSEAVAVRVTDDPETVAPLDGAVSETDGGVVSGVGAVLLPPPPPPPPP